MTTSSAPSKPDERRAGSIGVRNRRQRVDDRSRAPWEAWKVKSLPARAVKFMQTYCVAAKGMFAGRPIRVAKFQRDWLEEVLAPGVDSSAMTLPRGNGKSGFAGAVATWATFDPAVAEQFGGRPDVPVVATTLKIARKAVYGAACDYRRMHPELRSRSLRYTASGEERIVVPGNSEGELYPIAGDADTLQGLDPLMAVVDEIGFIDPAAWDALLLAAGKRPRNLILAIGTRNPEDVPNALDQILEQIHAGGEIPGFVLVDYSANPARPDGDRREWKRANPAIAAGFLRMAALETAYRLTPRPAFRTFRLNQKAGAQTGWLGATGPDIWANTEGDVQFDPGLVAYLGVDKAAYSDSAAVVMLQNIGDMWLARAWIFEPNPTIDHAAVRDRIRELCGEFMIGAVGYDDRYFVEGAQELEDEGLPMLKVPQTPQRLVGPFGWLYSAFVEGRIVHDPDPVFRRHVLGAVAKLDGSSGGFTLAKGRSRVKIDAAVALGIARAAALEEAQSELTDDMLEVH